MPRKLIFVSNVSDVVKSCPFCTGKIRILTYFSGGRHVVHCASCTAQGPTMLTAGSAIKAWNTRTERSKQCRVMTGCTMLGKHG